MDNDNDKMTSSINEEVYIGTNTEYYLPLFNRMRKQGRKISWNWCAFLFTPYWLIYRKMYLLGFGLLAINFIMNINFVLLYSFIMFTVYTLIGIFGNYIYMQRIISLSAAGEQIEDEFDRSRHVKIYSGVNSSAVVFSLIALMVLSQF